MKKVCGILRRLKLFLKVNGAPGVDRPRALSLTHRSMRGPGVFLWKKSGCRFDSGMGKKTGHFQSAWRKKSPIDYLIAKHVTLLARVIILCLFDISAQSFRI